MNELKTIAETIAALFHRGTVAVGNENGRPCFAVSTPQNGDIATVYTEHAAVYPNFTGYMVKVIGCEPHSNPGVFKRTIIRLNKILAASPRNGCATNEQIGLVAHFPDRCKHIIKGLEFHAPFTSQYDMRPVLRFEWNIPQPISN